MIGLALLAIGAVLLWAAFTKRGDSVLAALHMNLPGAGRFDATLPNTPISGGSGGGSASSGGTGSSQSDSGVHAGIDDKGNIISIAKDYGSMSDKEKDAANKFAHQIGNLGSTA